jgi:hypothetical protein
VTEGLPTSICAKSREKLIESIDRVKVVVGPLAERTNDRREWYTLKLGLPREIEAIPDGKIELKKSESPDFLLKTKSLTLGIEIAELRGPHDGWAQAIAEEEELGVHFVSPMALTNSETSRDMILQEMRNGARPFQGDEPEELAARALITLFEKKNGLRGSGHWVDSDQDWLLIYNNFGFAGLEIEAVVLKATQRIQNSLFDRVIVATETSNISVVLPSRGQTL